MNIISDKELKNLFVETTQGIQIGRIVGFEFDGDTQSVVHYEVKPKRLVSGIVDGNLRVHRDQVVSITSQKMIVEDLVIDNKSTQFATAAG